MVIRRLSWELEGFFEKSGKYLPVAGQCLRMAMVTVAFSEGVLVSPILGGGWKQKGLMLPPTKN